ncbi:MAG: hypothetical protein ACLQA5_00075 [Solirubrobacteraceae bacterium]
MLVRIAPIHRLASAVPAAVRPAEGEVVDLFEIGRTLPKEKSSISSKSAG